MTHPRSEPPRNRPPPATRVHGVLTRSRDRFARRRPASRGQTAPIGVVLVVAIVLIGTVAVVATGAGALADAQRQAELDRAEHAMTQFDSRASLVTLGESDLQSIALGASGRGQWDVDPDAGWVRIEHLDSAGNVDETIYNDTFGAFVYRNSDATVAYQGGGVWRSDTGTGSVMVAPPEFHYRDETLVFPIITVTGSDSASGTHRKAVVTGSDDTTRVFPVDGGTAPNGAGAPYDHLVNGTHPPYVNPVSGGNVTVTIQSEYYDAWGRFFEARTGGDVVFDHDARTVAVELTAPRFIGNFDMPAEGNAIKIRGIDTGHPLETFVVDLAPDDQDSAEFNNLQWSMYASNGNEQFELHLKLNGPNDDPATACKEQDIAATLYYSDANGDPYHGWHNPTAFRTSCTDRDGDGSVDEVRLVANLTGDTIMRMTDLTSSHLQYTNPGGATRLTTVTFDEHADDVDWEPVTYTDAGSNNATIGDLMKHYTAVLGPNYDLVVDDQNSDTVNEAHSSGVLEYEARGRVTFMHVTADPVVITLE